MSCPPDPAHSEYYGLVRRLYPLLYTKILTKRAAEEFTAALHCFPFPPGWGRIQSPAIHMASWSMSECARASVVIRLFLRCWLRNHHVRQPFRNGLKIQFPKECRHCASDEDLIVFCFGKLAWSNTLISSFELSLKDRQEFHSQIINARQYFLGLMNAAQNPKGQGKKKDNEKRDFVTEELSSSSRRASISETSINFLDGDTDTPFEEASVDNLASDTNMGLSASMTARNGEANKLPNFHIGMHFERVMQEYGVLWNVNVLFGEDKHRFFKQAVLSTNHRKPERQLLVKAAILFTVVALLNGSFRHTDPEITLQMIRLKRNCPALLESLLFHGDRSQTDDQESPNTCLLESPSYLKPAVRGKLKPSYAQNQGLPIRITNSTELRFRQLMQTAMIEYGLNCVQWGNTPLYWYEQCSFTVRSTGKRFSLQIGDFLRIRSGTYAQLRQIYTHCLPFEVIQRVFLWIRLLETASYKDEVLNLSIFQLTNTDRIIPLFFVDPDKIYIVHINRTLNEPVSSHTMSTISSSSNKESDMDLLHCTRGINFL